MCVGAQGARLYSAPATEEECGMRLRSDFLISAIIRQAELDGAVAMLRRRGAAEAGAIFVKVDRLDGTAALYAPAMQSLIGTESAERLWQRAHSEETVSPLDIEDRMQKEIRFDPDLWLIEIEDRQGRPFVALAEPG
jgi:hypothetical protein